jgi:hypothetical protein
VNWARTVHLYYRIQSSQNVCQSLPKIFPRKKGKGTTTFGITRSWSRDRRKAKIYISLNNTPQCRAFHLRQTISMAVDSHPMTVIQVDNNSSGSDHHSAHDKTSHDKVADVEVAKIAASDIKHGDRGLALIGDARIELTEEDVCTVPTFLSIKRGRDSSVLMRLLNRTRASSGRPTK